MCRTCSTVELLLREGGLPDATAAALDSIERAIKKGKPAEHFKGVMDKLLGTEMAERDEDLEARWERGYRNGKDDSE